jgi:hypothetical protein
MPIRTKNNHTAVGWYVGLAAALLVSCVPAFGQPVLDLPPAFKGYPGADFFLTRKGVGDEGEASRYYQRVDPQNLRPTLSAWWGVNGFDPKTGGGGVRTAYTNNNDLGFGRDMHCIEDKNHVACYVTNYSKTSQDLRFLPPVGVVRRVLQDRSNAHLAFQASRTDFIATVCMEFSSVEGIVDQTKIVKFYVYAPNPKNPDIGASLLALSANLDDAQDSSVPGAPPKLRPIPRLCNTCHGGNFQEFQPGQLPNLHASFIAFDPESFGYSRDLGDIGASQADQEPLFKAQNLMVLDTIANPQTSFTVELINGWYHLGQPDERNTQDIYFVPAGWGLQPDRYLDIVRFGCQSCHAQQRDDQARDIDWSSFEQFRSRLGGGNGIQALVCTPLDPTGQPAHQMPHSYVGNLNFWGIGRPGPNALAGLLLEQGFTGDCE